MACKVAVIIFLTFQLSPSDNEDVNTTGNQTQHQTHFIAPPEKSLCDDDNTYETYETSSGNHLHKEDIRQVPKNQEEDDDSGSESVPGTLGDESDDYNVTTAQVFVQGVLDAYHPEVDQDSTLTSVIEDDKELPEAHIESLCISKEYIHLIQNATLDNGKLDQDTIDHLQNPIAGPITIPEPDDQLSLEIFAPTNANKSTYNQCHAAIL
ncbi:hypothetical protein H2248_000134 [Termitomyces sp. 'cryptogamus']|nr:hypothetical protein H2248_000134 [Termitomyces sp. 'cryptogamus']